MGRWNWVIGVAIMTQTLANAAESKPETDIPQLVQQLGSPSYAARVEATNALKKSGPAAIALLETAIQTHQSLEVRLRAETLKMYLIQQFDSKLATAEPPFRWNKSSYPLAEAVQEFNQKTGLNVVVLPGVSTANVGRLLNLPTTPSTAWKAFDQLCEVANLHEDYRAELPLPPTANRPTTSFYSGGRNFYNLSEQNTNPFGSLARAPILLSHGSKLNSMSQSVGGLRITALPGRFELNRVVGGSGQLRLHLEVSALAGTQWRGAREIRLSRAEDETGRPMFESKLSPSVIVENPWEQGFAGGMAMGRVIVWNGAMNVVYTSMNDDGSQTNSTAPNPRLVPLTLNTDDHAVRKLSKLEGAIVGEVEQANSELLSLEQLPSHVGKAHDGAFGSKLTVVSYATDATTNKTTMQIHYEMIQPFMAQQLMAGRNIPQEFFNIGNLPASLKFRDAAGNLIATPRPNSMSSRSDGFRQSITFTLVFNSTPPNLGPPMTLVQTGTKLVTIEVPFRFTNVSVP